MSRSERGDIDLLYGIKRIADHLGLTPRQVEHMIARCNLPTFKMGAIVCTTRSAIASHFEQLLAANRDVRGCTGNDRGD
jgi:hypothetical protein